MEDGTRYGANVTLKEAVEEIKTCKENRRLVSKFEAEHRDEIFEILGVTDYIPFAEEDWQGTQC